MHKEAREELHLRFKLLVLEWSTHFGPTKACREFEVAKSTFYEWKNAYKRDGVAGFKRKKPVAHSHPRKLSKDIVDKILHIRRSYQLGPIRIMWYLERYHGINISESSVLVCVIPLASSKLFGFVIFRWSWQDQTSLQLWEIGRFR